MAMEVGRIPEPIPAAGYSLSDCILAAALSIADDDLLCRAVVRAAVVAVISLGRTNALDAKGADGRRPLATVAGGDENEEDEDGENPASFPADARWRSAGPLS